MKYFESTLGEKVIYSGKVVKLKEKEVILPNGKKAKREIVEHPGAVCILAFSSAEEVVMVKQFRKALEEEIWEIPAGKLENNEDPLACAKRELKEETGYEASNWTKIGEFYTSPGFCNEIIHLFFARNLQNGVKSPDEDEFVDTRLFTWLEIKEMVQKGHIKDAKTLIAVLYAKMGEV